MIPYARQAVDDDDVAAVTRVLRSDFLTTGPEVDAFEAELAAACGVKHAIAVSSGTAALHCAYAACGVGPGDEVITSPLTFSATANMALALGATVRFGDIDDTWCLDPSIAISPATKVIAPVDFGGNLADIAAFKAKGVRVVEDASHAIGATGSLADLTVFSFHPVKTITTGEGGAVVTNDDALAQKARDFRNHGLVRDRSRLSRDDGPWYYEVQSLGFNYRLSAIHAALGRSQLKKLGAFVRRRADIVARYDVELRLPRPHVRAGVTPAWHLYAVLVPHRARVAADLAARGVGTQVHYVPVNDMPLYRGHPPTPKAARAYEQLLSLPLFPAMTDADVTHVIESVIACVR